MYWVSRLISPKGRSLLDAGFEANCDFYSTEKSTYWSTDPNKVPDLIDFFVAKGLKDNHIKVDECSDLSSDHTPIILTVSETFVNCKGSAAQPNKP